MTLGVLRTIMQDQKSQLKRADYIPSPMFKMRKHIW